MNFFCTQVDGPLNGGADNYIRSRAYTWQFTEYPVIGGEIYIYALLCSGKSTQVLLNWHGS